jgi:hypothetical protein
MQPRQRGSAILAIIGMLLLLATAVLLAENSQGCGL